MYKFRIIGKQRAGRENQYLVEDINTKERRVVPSSWVKEAITRGLVCNAGLSGSTIYSVKDKVQEESNKKKLSAKKLNPLLEYKDGEPFTFKEEYLNEISKYIKKVKVRNESEMEDAVDGNITAISSAKYYPGSWDSPSDLDYDGDITENLLVFLDGEIDSNGLKEWLKTRFNYIITYDMLFTTIDLLAECLEWVDIYGYTPFADEIGEVEAYMEEGHFDSFDIETDVEELNDGAIVLVVRLSASSRGIDEKVQEAAHERYYNR